LEDVNFSSSHPMGVCIHDIIRGVKAQVTSAGGQVPSTQRIVKRDATNKPSTVQPKDPADVFKFEGTAAPSVEDKKVSEEKTPQKAESPAVVVAQPKSEAPKNDPGVLIQLDEPVAAVEPKKGMTLAELAKSATQGLVKLIAGDPLKPFQAELKEINQAEAQAQKLKTPEQFAAKTADFKARLAKGESLESMRVEAYAVAREAASQATGMRAYDCQVLGALAMDDGHISEMRTGEGKTLTAVLPLYLNALAGKGAHLVTVNETLAKRDSEWMGPIFDKLGMSVGCVTEDQTPGQKRDGYNSDVTYVSDRALGFDFLRDRGATDPAERVQRGTFFALIDEVDEVLIDEARTPMIMSGKSGKASPDYNLFGKIAKDLIPGDDFKLNEEKRTVWLTDGGLRFVENEVTLLEAQDAKAAAAPGSDEAKKAQETIQKATLLRGAIRRENAAQKQFDDLDYDKPNPIARAVGMNGEYDADAAQKSEASLTVATQIREKLSENAGTIDLYAQDNMHRVHYMEASLKAHTQFVKGKDYTVENGEVKIVDTNKGRVSDGKRYSNGLHQALEAKEGLPVGDETRTVSKITMPELIAQYERKSGMTGTGKTSEAEFMKFYDLDVIEIPTNKPVIRTDHPDAVFATKEAKYQAVVDEAVKAASEGRPILVGTVSVNSNREIAARLLNSGWPADRLQILNAERVKGGEDFHDPNAGRSGTITLTTGERADNLKHDPVNYKKMAFLAHTAVAEGKPVLVDMDSKEDAEQVQAWLQGAVPVSLTDKPDAQAGGVQIRVRKNKDQDKPEGFAHVDAADHAIEQPKRFKLTEDNLEDVLPKAMEAFSDGEPVVLETGTAKGLGEAAEQLLDRGLGLEAIPMVCEGKEKENVMIEMAGRSGVITVATNMAGRGANIKPDLVAINHISEAAYEKAAEGKPVTISVEKKSQAVKIQRLLDEHIDATVAESREQKAKNGQVLIKVEDEPTKPEEGEFLKGADFATDGLYVIGTERAYSRRVDNQLIGRSGRQGADGDSKFFLSLEDDVPRIFGGENFEPVLNMFGDAQKGVTSDMVNGLLDKAQERVEGQHFEQRDNAGDYDKVNRVQRETFYKMREDVLTGEDDPAEFVADYGAQGLADMVRERLGDKRAYPAAEVDAAVRQVAIENKIPVSVVGASGKIKTKDLDAMLYPQVLDLLKNPNLSEDKLKRATLMQLDGSWQEHLENMDSLRDGIHLESIGGRKPEEVFVERGFEVFEEMIGSIKKRMAANLLPAAGRLPQNAPSQS
jgi:preprotein translocase subunit SecA